LNTELETGFEFLLAPQRRKSYDPEIPTKEEFDKLKKATQKY